MFPLQLNILDTPLVFTARSVSRYRSGFYRKGRPAEFKIELYFRISRDLPEEKLNAERIAKNKTANEFECVEWNPLEVSPRELRLSWIKARARLRVFLVRW